MSLKETYSFRALWEPMLASNQVHRGQMSSLNYLCIGLCIVSAAISAQGLAPKTYSLAELLNLVLVRMLPVPVLCPRAEFV